MARLRLLTVPYHLGRERVGMGKGPDRFVEAGAVSHAEERGLAVEVQATTRAEDFEHEVGATFDVLRAHARRVRQALDQGAFPLTLGGNCSTSGFLDGMPLAVLAGWCWHSLAATVLGFQPVPERNLLLAGARAVDAEEQRLLEDSEITVVAADEMHAPEQLHERCLPALEVLLGRVARVYVHVDLDVIDLADGRANEFAAPGGPTLEALSACLRHIVERGHVAAASLTSYNPDCDEDGRALLSGSRLLDGLFAAAGG